MRAFELVWNDGGSGARQDGSFYRPIRPAGYFALGHYGQGDYAAPDGTVAVARELSRERGAAHGVRADLERLRLERERDGAFGGRSRPTATRAWCM